MEVPGNRPLLRIGELSRRLGVSDHVLRGAAEPLRSAVAGALTGGPVTEAEQAGWSR